MKRPHKTPSVSQSSEPFSRASKSASKSILEPGQKLGSQAIPGALNLKFDADLQAQGNEIFAGAEAFMGLLLRQSARTSQVVVRTYGNGAWSQFSGKDFASHLGRSAARWTQEFYATPEAVSERRKKPRALLFIVRNTYSAFVAAWGAMLAGLDVMHMPSQASMADIKWSLEYFKGVGIVTDMDELAPQLGGFGCPVFNVSRTLWAAQDRQAEPELFRVYRYFKTSPEARLAQEMSRSSIATEIPLDTLRVGRMQFVSFGHDGFQKPEMLLPDALVLTAQNFLLHLGAPASIFWKSMELMAPSNPFAHLSRICVLLKNGVIGFPQASADWETNLRILRPSVLFASPLELSQVCEFVEWMAERPLFRSRLTVSETFEKARTLLNSARALKLPEKVFETARRALRTAGRISAGEQFLKESVGDLKFVVHGLAGAADGNVRLLERLGIPVVETYGVTHAAGLLSSNTFDAAHCNLIGSPLPHVSFRLGANSLLEYRLSLPVFENAGRWEETGDVAQMTPYGFAITGRKKHLFVTAGGVTISPVRLETLLREQSLIADACIVGDRMPFLAALLVLSQNGQADYRETPELVRENVQKIITELNETLPRNATIKKFVILDKPFQEAEGEKLSTGAVNRLKIHETRQAIISSLYT